MLNHGLNHGLFLWEAISFTFQVFWVKIHSKLNEFRILKYQIAILFPISGFYLKYIQAILPETSPFSTAQMAVLSSFFLMFIVLGMYNFAM